MEAARYHEHYLLQSQWLAPARHFLYRKAGLASCRRVLDLGCGSGIIADELRNVCGHPVLAVDRDRALIDFARAAYPGNEYLVGDENTLARGDAAFDLVVLSFVLMWQPRPLAFLKKLRGLLREGGKLLLLGEPDYGGRIDFPAGLAVLKDVFAGHIAQSGGDPFIGRRLASLLRAAGFQADVSLASALAFPAQYTGKEWEREWRFWQELAGFSDEIRKRIMRLEKRAAARRERLVLFPVFCALAAPGSRRVPCRSAAARSR